MRPVTYTTIATSIFALASARQAADIPLSVPEYESYGCGSQCRSAIETAATVDLEHVGRDFDYDFYATARNFTTALPPGRVLKLQTPDANTLDVRAGTTVHRLQYTTRDLDGGVVPATAFIALPQVSSSSPPRDGDGDGSKFPLVAWAHGTVGLFASCPPSNGPRLYDYGTWQPLVQQGYAVVATDYAGLGSNYTSHKYGSNLAHANDVYYAVQAARSALGGVLAEEWMAAGHSQGGGAVWKLAESKLVRNDTRYLGTVAVAPATYIVDMIFENIDKPTASLAGYLPYIPFAVERAVPSLNGSSLAGPTMRKRLRLAERSQLCIAGMFSLATGLNQTQLVDRDGFERAREAMLRWQADNSAALGDRSPAPVLVVQGAGDTVVLPGVTERAWGRSCGYGNEVHLRLYEGQEHSPTMEASAPEWLRWIDDRFAGRGKEAARCARACTRKTRSLVAGKKTKTPPESP